MKCFHCSPTYYSTDSVVGGGEKYILYLSRAITRATSGLGISCQNNVVAFGPRFAEYDYEDALRLIIVPGQPWDPGSIDVDNLRSVLSEGDIVFVHQCLAGTGLLVASHAKLLKKWVIGIDHGGGEHHLVHQSREVGRIFDLCIAQSQYAASAFKDLDVGTEVILGPVDDTYYTLDPSTDRVHGLVLSVGRLLPHKSFDRLITALPSGTHLVIAGTASDPEYLSYLRAQSSKGAFEIRERLSDDAIRCLMRQASLYVHPTSHFDFRGRYYPKPELLGLAPLEALCCGTPALVSAAGSLPELGSLSGVEVFTGEGDLPALMQSKLDQPVDQSLSCSIAESVSRNYGLLPYGRCLLTVLESLGAL
ncbi:MAG: glycosyltransferase family 4 protein [Bryobacteraceae bacterium]|nr:glycosyltransferase family 4 protein [Bryobacteraceae bacterium]